MARSDEAAATAVAVKFDAGKMRPELLPPDALRELVLVYTIGAIKYGDDNYLNGGLSWRRVIGALERHLLDWIGGEQRDQEDGQHHLASVAWCALTLLVYEMRCLGEDDRDHGVSDAYDDEIAGALSAAIAKKAARSSS